MFDQNLVIFVAENYVYTFQTCDDVCNGVILMP